MKVNKQQASNFLFETFYNISNQFQIHLRVSKFFFLSSKYVISNLNSMNLSLIKFVLIFQAINVDLTHIENRISDIVKSEKHVQLVLGQLIDE